MHGFAGILLGSTGSEWGEASEEGVKTREWDKVHSELTEVRVQLTREADAAVDTCTAEVVEVTIGWDGGFLVYRCRCHTGPRCRCKGTRRLSRQAGGRRRWHWLDGTTEKVRAAKTRGREERGHCCRQGKEDPIWYLRAFSQSRVH